MTARTDHRGAVSLWILAAAMLLLGGVVVIGLVTLAVASSTTSHSKIVVVAAEDEYGSMAQAIGGSRVSVTSLLSDPTVDPHSFEANVSAARTLSEAALVIKNGIGYDAWMDKLLNASPRSGRTVFSVGEYLGRHNGDNPHIWYSPSGWAREAAVITSDLTRLDPSGRAYFQHRRALWLHALQPVYREIAAVRRLTRGKAVIATEPVYGYMIAALGARSLDYDFQKAIMGGTDPSPRSRIAFQSALEHHTARMLFYNSQVTGPTTSNLRAIASRNHVPIVGVTETQPSRLSFVQWQLGQLQNIKRRWR